MYNADLYISTFWQYSNSKNLAKIPQFSEQKIVRKYICSIGRYRCEADHQSCDNHQVLHVSRRGWEVPGPSNQYAVVLPDCQYPLSSMSSLNTGVNLS